VRGSREARFLYDRFNLATDEAPEGSITLAQAGSTQGRSAFSSHCFGPRRHFGRRGAFARRVRKDVEQREVRLFN
jgi:hypothetical protein